MKILFIVYSDLSLEAGHTTHVKELAQNLERNGNSITLIARMGGNDNISVSKSYVYNRSSGDSLFRKSFHFLLSLLLFLFRILINTRHVDVIYFRNVKLGFIAVVLKTIFRKKMIFEANGLEYMEQEMRGVDLLNKTFSKILKFGEMITIKNSDKIISVTEKIKDVFLEEYKIKEAKVIVINNGVNIDLFTPIMDKGVIKKEIRIKNDEYVVGFIGTFKQWHGLEYLIKSASLVTKELPNTKFLLVGDGILKENCITLVKHTGLTDNFIFIDTVPYEEVPRYMNAFDVCAILKKKDIPGSPLKLWEYMACGKPVIATNTEDFKALEEYNAGILVDPEKTEDIADAIITLLKNKELREEMGENGRNYVVENRSWETVAREVVSVMKEAAKRKRG